MKRILAVALLFVVLVGQVALVPPDRAAAQSSDGSPTSDPATSTEVPLPPVVPTDPPAEVEIADEPAIGQQVQVNTSVLNVRATPDVSGTIVTKLVLGAVHTVIDGPVTSGAYQWYELDLPGDVDGWAVGLYLDIVEGGAATSTPGTTPSATATSVVVTGDPRVGDTIAINTPTLNVRSGAGTTFTIVTTASTGPMFTVNGGPSSGSGMTWIRLDLPGSTDGWVATQFVRIVSRPYSDQHCDSYADDTYGYQRDPRNTDADTDQHANLDGL